VQCQIPGRIGGIIHRSHPLHGEKGFYEVAEFRLDPFGEDAGALMRYQPE
jgi:hypothetical protein